MGRALMIGGVFLLARDPSSLADWYQRHPGWRLNHLAGLGFREHRGAVLDGLGITRKSGRHTVWAIERLTSST